MSATAATTSSTIHTAIQRRDISAAYPGGVPVR